MTAFLLLCLIAIYLLQFPLFCKLSWDFFPQLIHFLPLNLHAPRTSIHPQLLYNCAFYTSTFKAIPSLSYPNPLIYIYHVFTSSKQSHISPKRSGVGVSASSLLPVATHLFHHRHLSSLVDLEKPSPLPLGWQKFLDFQTGEIYYSKAGEKGLIALEGDMSRRNGPKLDLKLNLSPPRISSNPLLGSPSRSLTVSPTSPPSSCVSSERNLDESPRYASSPEATSMMLVGCPRCLMYVMLTEEDPRCPKCKSTVLLDVIPDSNTIFTGRKTKKS